MKNARNTVITAAWIATALTLTVSGCGQSTTSATSSGAGGSSTASSGSGGSGGAGGATGTGGSTSSTSSAGGGSSGTGGGGGGVVVMPEDFEGIDVSTAPSGKPPGGCVGGFDVATGALDLALGGEVSALVLATVGGEIQANGVTCTAADQTAATTSNTLTIHVVGTAADETVILDLATGHFGPTLLTTSGGIHLDLGAGQNSFFLRGSAGADAVTAGTVAGAAVFDPEKAGAATVEVLGAHAITVSLGPGDDLFRASGVAGSAQLALAVTVFGGAGNDGLQGGSGDDMLHGGDGDDTFKTSAKADGADVYDGGEGSDTMDYANRTAALVVTMGDQLANDGEASEHDDVNATVEGLLGGSGDDSLTGSAADDSIYGNAGDDQLFGGPGSDLLDGGPGQDVFDAGGGDGDICITEGTEVAKACEL